MPIDLDHAPCLRRPQLTLTDAALIHCPTDRRSYLKVKCRVVIVVRSECCLICDYIFIVWHTFNVLHLLFISLISGVIYSIFTRENAKVRILCIYILCVFSFIFKTQFFFALYFIDCAILCNFPCTRENCYILILIFSFIIF